LTNKAKVRAVLKDDTQIALPTVRTRHLPVLSIVSAGRLEDPTGLTTADCGPETGTAPDDASSQDRESRGGSQSLPEE
jgi:hypothetical protein